MPKPPTDKLTDRLNRLSHFLGTNHPPAAPSPVTVPQRYHRLANQVNGQLVSSPSGNYVLIKSSYGEGHQFGRTEFALPHHDATVSTGSFRVQDCADQINLSDLLFFDTETTGLGGTGAVAFLIGFGSLTPDGFEVRQYLLPDYEDESGMLEEVLEEFAAGKVLVSYNGLAFDSNLLRDRMIVNRVARELPITEHIDLLHTVRRLFRRRLKDCSLGNIEEQLFGFCRTGDIPGYLVPSAYFNWLDSEDASSVVDVLEHNCQDILTLYFLLLELDRVFRTDGEELVHTEDIYSLSRLYGRRRQPEKVVENHRRLEQGETGMLEPEIRLFHSMAFKRAGDWQEAVSLWTRLAGGKGKEALAASLELAKYYEHRAKQPEKALDYTVKAKKLSGMSGRTADLLMVRLQRLNQKTNSKI